MILRLKNLAGGWSFPVSLLSQMEWLELHYNDQNAFRFIIDTNEDGPAGAFL